MKPAVLSTISNPHESYYLMDPKAFVPHRVYHWPRIILTVVMAPRVSLFGAKRLIAVGNFPTVRQPYSHDPCARNVGIMDKKILYTTMDISCVFDTPGAAPILNVSTKVLASVAD